MLRNAEIVDGPAVAMLVLHELERRQYRQLRRVTKEQLSQLLFVGYREPNFRYNYHLARVYQNQGVAVGVAFGFPAEQEGQLDNQWTTLFERLQITPPQQPVVRPRALPDEWYLDLLTVNPRYAHKTYQLKWFDEWLMTDVLRCARVNDKPVVGLDVRPGTAIASLAAQYGFVSTQRRRFDRQTYLHLRYRRP
ncbi:hypothetical protein FD30_GL000216 [Levilactobacillus namurensis DSM 19117]|uniref:N-acetyltransferase domain-containing protein n=1 Tax=Levilactobacillus namurensis DSM 19117 TaxID=1423773 RepID=A0A0R1KBY5_9LACO|nr:hypothetical protein [Levilactobacillus namurensis]KRK77298.1 hypothetical protein FD30_GL000216 [Levilactobacillus namurensis DSM 19117]GEO73950.1 N-acetyltransferase [Levilactobacillus namurensis]